MSVSIHTKSGQLAIGNWCRAVKEMAETSSSSSSTKSDEEKVEMLDRLLTRLALCDDSKLQPLLSKLLPFTVSSLSSNSSAVRNKVCFLIEFASMNFLKLLTIIAIILVLLVYSWVW